LKSTDGGTSWATANGALPTTNVLALAIDPTTPSTLFAGTDAGVFKSTDSAQSWTAANDGLVGTSQVRVNALAIDSGSPATLYAATSVGLFKTIDGASNWTSISAGLAGLTLRAIAIDPASPSTIYVGVNDDVEYVRSGVLKSTDAGTSWTMVYTTPIEDDGGWPVAALVMNPRAPDQLYLALAYAGGVVSSVDGGSTWSSVKPAPYVLSLAIDPALPVTLYAGTSSGGVFRSNDAGDHWTPVTDAPLAAAGINVIAPVPWAPATVYAGAGTGIYRSPDRGESWTHLSLGLRNISAYSLAVDPTVSSTIYTGVGGAVTRSTDGGVHWSESRVVDSDPVVALAIDPASPSTLYAGIGGFAVVPLYKSTDAGAHWTPASNGLSSGRGDDLFTALAFAPSRNSTLYVSELFGGVFKSIDGGSSWTKVNSGLTPEGGSFGISALAVDPANADIVYAATIAFGPPRTEAKFYKSTNGAVQWRQIPIPLPTATSINSFTIDPDVPSTIYAAYENNYRNIGTPGDGGVLKSSDGGETWSTARGLLPTTPVLALAIDPSARSHIYAATQKGVFRSTDGATSWRPLNAGLPSLNVWDIAIDRTGSLLRAATTAGLFEYKISGPPPPATVALIECFHAASGDYFITLSPGEISKLDDGTLIGWMRTGFQFNAYDEEFVAGAALACRFFSTSFAPKSSHFFTPFPAECATVQADPNWSLESPAAFYIAVPAADGSCPADLMPVYRLYNNGQGGAPHHRYTTDFTVRAQMMAQRWVPEGLGPDGVEMCSPR